MILSVGIHDAIPMADYLRDPCPAPSLSSHIARLLIEASPLHAAWAHPRLNPEWQPDDDTKFDLGTAAHAVLLERRPLDVLPYTDWRKNEAKAAREEAISKGRIPVLTHQAEAVHEMVHAIHEYLASSELPKLFDDGLPEQTVIWQEGETWLRCRPDWISSDGWVVNFKTTDAGAEPGKLSRTISNMGYDLQAAFELRGVHAIVGGPARYVWLVCEAEPPYACSLAAPSPAMLALGQAKCDEAIKRWRECLLNDSWPGYEGRIAYLEPPSWQLAQWEERIAVSQLPEVT